ncbi:hypothetical protein HDA40_006286 [Hamadaea flava]|nr:hypothetical protein [Hamadaea flava]
MRATPSSRPTHSISSQNALNARHTQKVSGFNHRLPGSRWLGQDFPHEDRRGESLEEMADPVVRVAIQCGITVSPAPGPLWTVRLRWSTPTVVVAETCVLVGFAPRERGGEVSLSDVRGGEVSLSDVRGGEAALRDERGGEGWRRNEHDRVISGGSRTQPPLGEVRGAPEIIAAVGDPRGARTAGTPSTQPSTGEVYGVPPTGGRSESGFAVPASSSAQAQGRLYANWADSAGPARTAVLTRYSPNRHSRLGVRREDEVVPSEYPK